MSNIPEYTPGMTLADPEPDPVEPTTEGTPAVPRAPRVSAREASEATFEAVRRAGGSRADAQAAAFSASMRVQLDAQADDGSEGTIPADAKPATLDDVHAYIQAGRKAGRAGDDLEREAYALFLGTRAAAGIRVANGEGDEADLLAVSNTFEPAWGDDPETITAKNEARANFTAAREQARNARPGSKPSIDNILDESPTEAYYRAVQSGLSQADAQAAFVSQKARLAMKAAEAAS